MICSKKPSPRSKVRVITTMRTDGCDLFDIDKGYAIIFMKIILKNIQS